MIYTDQICFKERNYHCHLIVYCQRRPATRAQGKGQALFQIREKSVGRSCPGPAANCFPRKTCKSHAHAQSVVRRRLSLLIGGSLLISCRTQDKGLPPYPSSLWYDWKSISDPQARRTRVHHSGTRDDNSQESRQQLPLALCWATGMYKSLGQKGCAFCIIFQIIFFRDWEPLTH